MINLILLIFGITLIFVSIAFWYGGADSAMVKYVQVLGSAALIISIFNLSYTHVTSDQQHDRLIRAQTSTFTHNNWIKLEKNLLKEPLLWRLYREMYPGLIFSYPLPLLSATDAMKQEQMEAHMASILFQVMADTIRLEELEKNKNSDIGSGWMNAFNRWMKSKTVRKYWDYSQDNYSQACRKFINENFV